jgi:hypothetical protein
LRDEDLGAANGVRRRIDLRRRDRPAGSRYHDDRVLAGAVVDVNEGRAGGIGCGLRDARCVPSRSQVARAMSPKASRPILETRVTAAPHRAAATAWLEPFPPGPMANPDPAIVSPTAGIRIARNARSATNMPRMATPLWAIGAISAALSRPAPRRPS